MEVINYLLGYKDMKIYQNTDYFNFSLDSVLLANFTTINSKINKILDIGTGNAVIPLILSNRTNCLIDGIEIQKEIYDLALKSVKLNKLEKQINIINEDVLEFYKKNESDIYDVITCNPPFFVNNKLNRNSVKSIARHELSLQLEDVMVVAKKLLKNNGRLSIVHRTERLVDILELMRSYNIEPKKIQMIYPKKNTESNIVLVEGVKNGKKGLKILNPLIVHKNNNEYSKEVLKYFKN